MLGSELTIQNDASANCASAAEVQKIETAVGILNSASGSIDQTEQDFITNINKIEYTSANGRSGTDLTTGTFYVSQSDLDNYSAGEFATDITHDGQHVDQYTSGEYKGIDYSNGVPNAGASMSAAVQLEKDATNGQLAVGAEIGVTSDISSRLSTYSADANGQIEARLNQPPSPSSRRCSARPPPVPWRTSGALSVTPSRRSHQQSALTSSPLPDMTRSKWKML